MPRAGWAIGPGQRFWYLWIVKRDVEAATNTELVELLKEVQPNGYGTRRAALAATELGLRGDSAYAPALIQALRAKNHVAVCAARALALIGSAEAVQPLVAVLHDAEKLWAPRRSAADALGKLRTLASEALPALRRALGYATDGTTWNPQCAVSVHEAILRIEAAGEGRAEWCERSEHECRHCEGVLLRMPRSTDTTAALECSMCRRTFLQRQGEDVVDLASPLSLALYAVIFSSDLSADVERVADSCRRRHTRRECRELVAAVRRELARPTQEVSNIHKLRYRPSEEEVRSFLRDVADALAD